MRRALIACALVAAVIGSSAAPAQARRTYCDPNGDYCLGMFKVAKRIYLGIDTYALRGKVRLCITSPNGKRKCLIFKLRRDAKNKHLYKAHVKWSDHFPHGQKGLYRVVWHYGSTKLPGITFTV